MFSLTQLLMFFFNISTLTYASRIKTFININKLSIYCRKLIDCVAINHVFKKSYQCSISCPSY